jgi:hypothetical protein
MPNYTLRTMILSAALTVAAVSKQPVSYRTVQVDGLSIFYREAGPKDAPAILLLHGFPSSSRMYEPLLARLSDLDVTDGTLPPGIAEQARLAWRNLEAQLRAAGMGLDNHAAQG